MPIRITVELIPRGDETKKRKLAVVNVINDGTGNDVCGNYRIDAEGECSIGVESLGWSAFEGFPRTLESVDRHKGYLYLAAEAMQMFGHDATPKGGKPE